MIKRVYISSQFDRTFKLLHKHRHSCVFWKMFRFIYLFIYIQMYKNELLVALGTYLISHFKPNFGNNCRMYDATHGSISMQSM